MTQASQHPSQITQSIESYQTELIESLKDPIEAAAYLEAALDPNEVALLPIVLSNLVEAGVIQSEQLQACLKTVSDDRSLAVIKALVTLINQLGFEVVVAPKE